MPILRYYRSIPSWK